MTDNDDADDDDSGAIGVGKYPCMPSLVALQQMRNRLHLAYVGKKLMKWTTVATSKELRRIAVSIQESYVGFPTRTAEGYILLARVRYFYPNLNRMVMQNPEEKAAVTVTPTFKSITGVKVINYEIKESVDEPYVHLGIEKGGQIIKEAKKFWRDLLKNMILILELREGFISVHDSNRAATKKMNVLGKIVIPRTKSSIAYILAELEEKGREEFYRIKKMMAVKDKIKRRKAAALKVKEAPIAVIVEEPPALPEEVKIIVPPVIVPPPELCIVCNKVLTYDEEIKPRKKRQDDGKLQEYKYQLKDLLEKTKDVNENKMLTASVKDFLSATENLIDKLEETSDGKEDSEEPPPIPEDLDPNKLCISCRRRLEAEKNVIKVSDTANDSYKEDTVQIFEQCLEEQPQYPLRPEVDLELGIFETEIEETIQVIRKRNEDGTITEERKVTKIQKKARRPL